MPTVSPLEEMTVSLNDAQHPIELNIESIIVSVQKHCISVSSGLQINAERGVYVSNLNEIVCLDL